LKTAIAENNADFKKSSNAVIALHFYYYDLADETLAYFQHVEKVEFLMTLPAHSPKSVVDKIITAMGNAYLRVVPNKGGDI